MLCKTCADMFQIELWNGNPTHHHNSLEDLVTSATEKDCSICRVVLQELDTLSGAEEDNTIRIQVEASLVKPILSFYFYTDSSDPSRILSGVTICTTGSNFSFFKLECKFLLWPVAQQDLHFMQHDHYESLPSMTEDLQIGQLALSWLEKCLKTHAKCSNRAGASSFHPPRVLDTSGETLRLIICEEKPLDGPYAALSHCWGPNPDFLTLTTNRLPHMQRELMLEELPTNFQNAVQICRWLGIKYIWIDSLCIIQQGPGSQKDWSFHAKLMRAIYASCVVCIASSRASSASESCFSSRDPAHIIPFTINLPLRTSPKSGSINFPQSQAVPHILMPENLHQRGHYSSKLASRGWVLQERVLSPRVLTFGPQQVFWECTESQNECETFPNGIPLQLYPKAPFGLPAKSGSISEENSRHWQDLVQSYTNRQLTKTDADKFVAFAGIAEHMAASFGYDEYVAGFFRHELPRNLLWAIPRDSIPKTPPESSGIYRAPSWSWASTDTVVQVFDDHMRYSHYNPPQSSLATVEGYQLDLVDPTNKFGQLQYAHLNLKAKLVPLSWNNTDGIRCPEVRAPDIGYCHDNVAFFFDSEADFYGSQDDVFIIGIILFEGWCFEGLVARRVAGTAEETFKRIGKGRIYDGGDGVLKRLQEVKERSLVLI